MSKEGSTITQVAAVLAAYNRRDLTLACLRSRRAQQIPDVALDVFVLDETSGDSTSEAIAEQFPEVTVLHGNGSCTGTGDAARLRRRHRRRLRAVRGYVQEPTKETVPIPELIKDPNDAAPVARR